MSKARNLSLLSAVEAGATTDQTKADLNAIGVSGGRKNLIINGAMQVNQRGVTSGITSGYFVDRFTLSGCSASSLLTSSLPTGFTKGISISATGGNPIAFHKVESASCQHLSGQTVTASFYAKSISNATTLYVKLQHAGSADSWGSSTTISEQNLGALSSSWVKYTASWTVPAGGLNGLSLGILCAGTGTFEMGVTGVQLELGSVATDFEHRSYGEELALCQRYFERRSYTGSAVVTIGTAYEATHCMAGMNFMEKRAIPSITMPACSAAGFSFLTATGNYPSNHGTMTVTGSTISKNNFRFASNNGAGHTAGDATWVHSGGTNHIDIDSEL